MKWLPKTAFGQIAATLTLLLLANLLISFLVLRWLVIDPSAAQFAKMIDIQVSLLSIQLADKNAEQADLWLKKNLPDTPYEIKTDISSLDTLPDYPFYRALIRYSSTLSNAKQNIAYSKSDKQSWLWLQSAWMQNYTLGIPFRTYVENVFRLATTVFAISTLISIIAAYIITAYLLAPLKQLGRLAEDLPKLHQNLPTIKHRGPIEIQQVTTLVEDAAQQMRKVVQDRELILAGVSHDLRSPLACLRISTEWIEDKKLREEMVGDIENIDTIIDSFLNFMRAGENEKLEAVNIQEFIGSILNDCKRRKQNVDLLRCDDISISLRPIAITRLICNLIDNAFKHAQSPITLEAYRENSQFQIWVKDSGKGIPDEQVEHLLEPFVQAETSRTKRGSGLGLAIAKRIAITHKARLIIKNRKSGGLNAGIVFS